ncbi:hypothetical protein M1E17_09345 [Arthrobacter sp. D1-29]
MTNRPHAANFRPFVFKDAVELLDGKSSQIIDVSDRVATAAILTAGVAGASGAFSLLGPKNALVKACEQIQGRIPNEVSGSSGIDRTRLLVAAHSILVITSFFDAASLIQVRIPDADVKLTGKEELQVALRDKAGAKLNNLVDFLMTSEIPYPKPELAPGQLHGHLGDFYDNLSASLANYCKGLRFWDSLDDRMRRAVERYFEEDVPGLALVGYQDSLRKLASQVHEFEIWLNQLAAQGIIGSIRDQGAVASEKLDLLLAGQRQASQQFDDLQSFLSRVAADLPVPSTRTSDLVRRIYSVTQLSLIPPDVSRLKEGSGASIPSLSELYIEPPFKVITGRSQANVSKEEWWRTVEPRHNIDDFFSAYLTTSPAAFTSPLLVLGHPGSGKSSLTRVLAARLPETMYVPIRVELRRVTPSHGIEVQIEEGLSSLLGRTTTWSEFRQATDLTPVIFLDGLDELIQASEERQADYLEQVELFQQRELAYGGAYVIVTSRTVVADQTRIPPNAIVLKIDDFSSPEISAFIDTWNYLNRKYFEEARLRPLPKELPREVVQLAGQPLLLLLLALLDADSNALQSDVGTRTKASTYQQILTTFIRREVLKHRPQMADNETRQAIQSELLKLSYIALGMFNRGVQMVNTRQVAEDLTALSADSVHAEGIESVHKLLGRFFFVHQAHSNSSEGLQNAYEFLHSTFGEYLVAHLAHEVLKEVHDDVNRLSRARFAGARNADQWASTLFAFQPFSQRLQVLDFFAELSAESPPPGDMSDLLITLAIERLEAGSNHMSLQRPYKPTDLTHSAMLATYTCNLILLACCIRGDDSAELVGSRTLVPSVQRWDSLVHFWKSQLDSSAWGQLSQVLWARSSNVLPENQGSSQDVEIGLEFLTPASSSIYYLTPISESVDTSVETLQMVLTETSTVEQSRQLLSGDTSYALKGVVSAEFRVYFLAFQKVHLVFDVDDLLAQLQNSSLKIVPIDLVDPALRFLINEPACTAWLTRHLRVILTSPLIDQFQLSTLEQLVDAVFVNPPEDLGLLAQVIDAIVDADMGFNTYRLIDLAVPRRIRTEFLKENPGFALRFAVALARGGYHNEPENSNWAQLVTHVPLISLYDEDVVAPILAMTLARKHNLHNWGTSRGIIEASELPATVLRQMPIDDALFLIRCGARDPKNGIDKVQRFSQSWGDAHRGVREKRIRDLADAIRRLSERPIISLQAAIDTLTRTPAV